ncbi:MAG TPA: NAD(P)/FAD-dependent oxidoreductase [Actinopolymorphaceae bacterium]
MSSRSRWSSRARAPHVVVVGGGFAGLSAVRALRRAPVKVTLIDQHVYNVFQPLLYQVATATLNPGDISWFLRSVRSRQRNVRFVNGRVRAMDHTAKTVTLEGDVVVDYDYLIIAAGVTANFFGIPGAEEYSMPLYTRSQALAFRDAMFARLEAAAIHGTDEDLRVIIVGGGATGVEMAGALAELRNTDMPTTYPELDPRRTHITLMEMVPNLLGPFEPSLREYARKSLVKRGVDIRLGTAVKEVRPDGVIDGNGEFVPAGLVVWASGITVSDEVKNWDLPQGRGGRIVIDDHLRVRGMDHVFAIGDIASEEGDRALPQLAQPAMQQGKYIAELLADVLDGKADDIGDGPRFDYRDRGILATIGRSSAVAQIKRVPPVTGFPAWILWIVIHIFYLLGNRNRLATILNLAARYLFWRRGHNAIVGDTPPIPTTGAESTASLPRQARTERAREPGAARR